MPKSTTRAKRVADLIHHQLARILLKEINDPRLKDFSLTAVEVSPDLRQATVFYTVLNSDNLSDIKKALSKASGFLRRHLAETAQLRYVPVLRFVYDESIEKGSRMSVLIDQAIDEDTKLHRDDQEDEPEHK